MVKEQVNRKFLGICMQFSFFNTHYFQSVPLQPISFHSPPSLCCSTLLYFISLHSTASHFIVPSTSFHSVIFHSISFRFTLDLSFFHSTPFHSISFQFYPFTLHFIPFYSTPPYSILLQMVCPQDART